MKSFPKSLPSRTSRLRATPSGSRRRGAALLLILGILAVLGWLAAEIVRETIRQQSETAAFARRERLRETAWSATECVLAALRQKSLVDEGLFTVPEDAGALLKAAGFEPGKGLRVVVKITDDSGKLGWNKLTEDPLRELLIDLGIPADAAAKQADILLDRFQDTPNRRLLGMKGADYADAGLPPPPELPPAMFAELLEAPGMTAWFCDDKGVPNDRLRKLMSCISLTGDTTAPNLNTASPALLRHLRRRGVIPDAEAFIARRAGPDGIPGTDDDRFARNPSDLAASGVGIPSDGAAFTVRRLKVKTRVEFGEASFLLTTLTDTESVGMRFPWKILKTEENRTLN